MLPETPPFSALIDSLVKVDAESDVGAAEALHLINRFFYQTDAAAPNHFSTFHAWWEQNHQRVLRLSVDKAACRAMAVRLATLRSSRPDIVWQQTLNLKGLQPALVANVRFFTAVQDFKINLHKSGKNPYQDASRDRHLFNPSEIVESPASVDYNLTYLEAQGAQGDKRRSWMVAQAHFLIDKFGGEAFAIAAQFDNNASAIRDMLIENTGLGFKDKKADMFLRDMADFGVWNYEAGVDAINVASDANTMRVALRAGLIRGRVPLLSSFLDIHGYQYALMDRITQQAWRAVWEEWGTVEPSTRPPTPASMDYLIYQSIGKTYCKKTARCKKNQGCPFDSVCPSTTRKLQPPKSISIVGLTSWTSAVTDEGGGLGLSS